MSKFSGEITQGFKTEVDEQKLWEYVCSEEFTDSFFDFIDLKEVLEHIAYGIKNEQESYDVHRGFYKFVEGFGKFIKEGNKWVSSEADFGTILIQFDDEFVEVSL
jgi:hypothetical protein